MRRVHKLACSRRFRMDPPAPVTAIAFERVWFAASDEIARMGPFATDVEAWEYLVLTPEDQAGHRRIHARGARVWPEWR
jgi:hypothetical protein